MRTLDEQIAAMEAQWPGFRVMEREKNRATWEGILAPDKREHLVRVRYTLPLVIENISVRDAQPRVQVISPKLERHLDYEEGPIPHAYVCESDRSLPYLCLFSPAQREWSADDLIAETTIFWAAQWLYFYEYWLLTKKWKGGGQHPAEIEGAKRLEPETV